MAATDKVFNAYGIAGSFPDEINEDLAWKVGHATAQFLRTKLSGYERGQASTNRIVLGYDRRPCNERLTAAVVEGISASGAGCVDLGVCHTPLVTFAVNRLASAGGIHITGGGASAEENGFVIVGLKGRAIARESGLLEIERIVNSIQRMPKTASMTAKQSVDMREDYARHVRKFLRPGRKLRVVIDLAHSPASVVLPEALGDESIELVLLNDTFEGKFAHLPEPLLPEGNATLCEAIAEHKADFGAALDGAGDRLGVADETGQVIRADLVTALLGRALLQRFPGSMVVYDLRSSAVVPEEVRNAGGVPRRERAGWSHIHKAMSDGHAVFGGDLSGRYYYRDNNYSESPLITVAAMASTLGAQDRPLSELIAPLRRYSYSGQIAFPGGDEQKRLADLEAKCPDAKADRLDGLTLTFDDGWLNVRPTQNARMLELTVEAPTPEDVHKRIDQAKDVLGEPLRPA